MPRSCLRVILVRPEEPGNVGAAARVLKNFGLAHLVLVDPRFPQPPKAYAWAHGAGDILEGADLEPDLETALRPVEHAFATTRRRGKHRGGVRLLREAAAASTSLGGSRAWVFGPESTGLTSRELALCSERVLIPTAPEHPSLNLAQAVALVAYELYLAGRPAPRTHAPGLATLAEREALYRHLETGLLRMGFLGPDSAPVRMGYLRRLLERSHPSPEEVRFLRGLARKLEQGGTGSGDL